MKKEILNLTNFTIIAAVLLAVILGCGNSKKFLYANTKWSNHAATAQFPANMVKLDISSGGVAQVGFLIPGQPDRWAEAEWNIDANKHSFNWGNGRFDCTVVDTETFNCTLTGVNKSATATVTLNMEK